MFVPDVYGVLREVLRDPQRVCQRLTWPKDIFLLDTEEHARYFTYLLHDSIGYYESLSDKLPTCVGPFSRTGLASHT